MTENIPWPILFAILLALSYTITEGIMFAVRKVNRWRQIRRIDKVTRQKIDGCGCFWCKA